jgi:hypothetical protein
MLISIPIRSNMNKVIPENFFGYWGQEKVWVWRKDK